MNLRAMPRQRQHGFILAATLWLIAFIAIAAAYLAQWASDARQQIIAQQQNVQAEIEFQSTLDTVIYLVNTHYINEFGVILTELTEAQRDASELGLSMNLDASEENYIKLYDQTYRGIGESLFSIQDESGLAASNTLYPIPLTQLLGLFGVPATEREDAIAKLLDYEDPDNFHRINGAEEQEYRRHAKPPPANRLLRTSWEMQNILGWDKYPSLWQNNLPRLASISWENEPNVNVAPKQVLQSIMGITREDAERIAQARKRFPITDSDRLFQITGKTLQSDLFAFGTRPSNFLRITLWHPQTGRMREIHLELHPFFPTQKNQYSENPPWIIEYQLDIAKTAEQLNAQPKQLKTGLFNVNHTDTKRFTNGNTNTAQQIP